MQLDLPPDSIAALDSHTEGWIAGLQLAAIAMQNLLVDKQVFVQNFTGSNRFVLDYLIEEVLSRQPENVRRFLLQTSILHRLNGSLCSAVTGEADGQGMIEHLERNNLFLVPLDQSRQWYRYHHLFGDLLQTRLLAEYPGTPKELRQRAARWHEENGFPEDAVVYALAAEDFEYAAQIITGPAVNVARRGEATTLLEWYKAFPPDFVESSPRLSLHFGLAFALSGRWNEAETLLNKIQQQDIASRPDDVLLLAYLVASYRHDAARLARIAEEAELALRTQPDPTTKLVLALITSLSGNLRDACQLLAEAQEGSERQGEISQAFTALFHQCRFRVFLGDLQAAHTLSRNALLRINGLGSPAQPMAIFAHVSLGRIFIEWNDLDNAAHHLAQAIRLAELTGFVTGILSSATMMQAEVKQAQGESEGAIQAAEAAIVYAERYDPPAEVAWLKTYQARIWLTQGNVAAAVDWMRSMQDQQYPPSMFYPHTIQEVTQARTLLAQRKTETAIAILTRLTAAPPDLLTVEALALLALARQSQGDSVHAILALEQALSLAQAENRIRTFFDLGSPMVKLLTRFCEAYPEHEYTHQLLNTLPTGPQTTPLIDPLSERELEVLRLIVAGHSNDEIAQILTLALSTVKWYINTLYSKLHVKTRSQAIARTHELKLLVD
jgi:LuxR family maltose regulon positive regulatory protein